VPEKLKDAPVVLVTKSKDRVWLEQIIEKYNKHKKSLPFYGIEKSEQVMAPNGP
jgi:BioD-like phosphotransacetylase family protein